MSILSMQQMKHNAADETPLKILLLLLIPMTTMLVKPVNLCPRGAIDVAWEGLSPITRWPKTMMVKIL
jgi:hypothetical protein